MLNIFVQKKHMTPINPLTFILSHNLVFHFELLESTTSILGDISDVRIAHFGCAINLDHLSFQLAQF